MTKKSYTVIFVPHGGSNYRKLHLSRRGLSLLLSLAATAVLIAGALALHYARFYGDLSELRRLQVLNAELRRQNMEYELSTDHLNDRVSSLQDFVKKLSVMAGLDTELPDQLAGGLGGPQDEDFTSPGGAFAMVKESLDQMSDSLTVLEEKSRVLERFYEEHTLMLASTPSIWPVRGYLSSSYGPRRDPFTGQREIHRGIDISTPVGRPVVATADGIVLFASRHGSYGNVIVIDHKFGYMTRYAHLDRFNVRPGKRVNRGDVVGYVGNTGRSSAPHLHYEVWVADRAVRPLDFILEYNRSFDVASLHRTPGVSSTDSP